MPSRASGLCASLTSIGITIESHPAVAAAGICRAHPPSDPGAFPPSCETSRRKICIFDPPSPRTLEDTHGWRCRSCQRRALLPLASAFHLLVYSTSHQDRSDSTGSSKRNASSVLRQLCRLGINDCPVSTDSPPPFDRPPCHCRDLKWLRVRRCDSRRASPGTNL